MPSSLFQIDEHVLPSQHIRHYPHAVRGNQDDALYISIKQYTPLNNLKPKQGDVTIIGAHANGFPKELYEPLWEDMLRLSEKAGFRIRSIWIADVSQQGQSGVLNEDKLGNDPSWYDHARDLLHMVNVFRDQMPRPLVGIGHSMGGAQLAHLALLHPRLLATLLLIDPVIHRANTASGNYAPAVASSTRRDIWPSREEARKAFLRSKFYQAWDQRVLDRWVTYGLRDLPTMLHPHPQPVPFVPPSTADSSAIPTSQPRKQVTLTTTKHNEVMTFLRPNFPRRDSSGRVVVDRRYDRLQHPDQDFDEHPSQQPFYRAEPEFIFHQLPFVRPSVMYLFGSESDISTPQLRADKLAATGRGFGGSGGEKEGRVKGVLLEKVGHLIPMERVEETAQEAVNWIDEELARWRQNEETLAEAWRQVPPGYENKLTPLVLETLKADTKRLLQQEAEQTNGGTAGKKIQSKL